MKAILHRRGRQTPTEPTPLPVPVVVAEQWDIQTRQPIAPPTRLESDLVEPDPTHGSPTRPDHGVGPDPTDLTRSGPESTDPTTTDPVGSELHDPTPVGDGAARLDSPQRQRDWVVDLGLAAAGIAAMAASYSALKGLARLTGWGSLDWLLWVCVDVYAITATRIWLSRFTKSRKVRRFAASNALGAVALSLAGNAAYHAISSHAWQLGGRFWILVVAVSAVPSVVIALIAHLAVLRTRDAEFAAEEAAEAARRSIRRPVDSTPAARKPVAPTRPAASGESGQADPTRPASAGDAIGDDQPPARLGRGDSPEATRRPVDPDEQLDDESSTGDQTDEPAPLEEPGDRDDARESRQEPGRRRVGRARPDSTRQSADAAFDPELIERAREFNARHLATKGRPAGADAFRERFQIGSKNARKLRDIVHDLHAVHDDQREERSA